MEAQNPSHWIAREVPLEGITRSSKARTGNHIDLNHAGITILHITNSQ